MIKCKDCKFSSSMNYPNMGVIADVKKIPLECHLNPPTNIFQQSGQVSIQPALTMQEFSCQFAVKKEASEN